MNILERCRKESNDFYIDFLSSAEKTVTDKLFELSEQSDNNTDQQLYFEAMQKLGDGFAEVITFFQHELDRSYQHFLLSGTGDLGGKKHFDAESLSLVQREQLEDDLVVTVIVSKANARNTEALWKLNRRLAVLHGGDEVTDESNPFGPARVFEAMHRSILTLDIVSKARLTVYKQIGKLFIMSVTKHLDHLNQLLAEQSVLPNLRFKIVRQPGGGEVIQSAVQTSAEDFSEAAASRQKQLVSLIEALQNSQTQPFATLSGVDFGRLDVSGEGGGDSFDARDYALALTAIQQSQDTLYSASVNRPQDAAVTEQRLVTQLEQQANSGGRHKLTRDATKTIDLVGMIFRYVFDDPKLPDSVKTVLSHLHTPYLKLALIDASFLDDHEHNARALLNIMSELGSEWVQDENDRAVLPKIQQAVDVILKSYIDDPSIFEELLHSFHELKQSLNRRAEMVERRTLESEQGLQKLEESRQRATDVLEELLNQYQTTAAISELIYQPWVELLSFNLIRHGEDSVSWQSITKVVEQVVRSVSTKLSKEHQKDRQRYQSELLETVREGLSAIGYDPHSSENLIESLKTAHQQLEDGASNRGSNVETVIEQVSLPDSEVESDLVQHAVSDHQAEPIQPAKPAETKHIATKEKSASKPTVNKSGLNKSELNEKEGLMLERLKQCPFGTWFECIDKTTGQSQNLKLAWFSGTTNRCMLVDHAGFKRGDETLLTLAQGLCSDRIRFANKMKKSFMERALEAVFKHIKPA